MKIKEIMKIKGLSENQLAKKLKMNRLTVHKVINGDESVSLKNYNKVRREILMDVENPVNSEYSIPVISLLIKQDKEWKIHLFNFVDYFRKNPDEELILLPPLKTLPAREKALLASTVYALCHEKKVKVPEWAAKMYWLKDPWFVGGFESLMAMAIVESPVYYRRNNIWVMENFLDRA